MKIITKYKQYSKLLEDKKPERLLKNKRNGLGFYLINDEFISILNLIDLDKKFFFELRDKLNINGEVIKTYNSLTYLKLNLFKNNTDNEKFGEVSIMALGKKEEYEIDDDTYLVEFKLDPYSNPNELNYICEGIYGIKKCIVYNVLNTEDYDSENVVFNRDITNLLKPKEFKELMEKTDYNQIVWYNNLSYIEYGLANNFLNLNKITYLSNLWYLVEKGIISKQDFVNKHPNWFLLKDNEVYIRYTKGDLVDLSFMFSEDDGGRDNSRQFVENLEDIYFCRDAIIFKDIDFYILKPESIKLIEDKIEKIYNSLDEEDKKEFDKYDDWEEKVKNIDALDELKDAIETAFNFAQNDADYDEMYDEVESNILDFFCMEKLEKDENTNYIFLLNKDFLIRFDNYFYGDYTAKYCMNKINEQIIDRLFEIVQEDDDSVEFLKIDYPLYGFDGSIDEDNLHEHIIEKLSEI